jgi:hypothetical protein
MPVPLARVCENPIITLSLYWYPLVKSHPWSRLSGPGCTIPKGSAGPGKACPVPSVPIKGFTQREKSVEVGCGQDPAAHSKDTARRQQILEKLIGKQKIKVGRKSVHTIYYLAIN